MAFRTWCDGRLACVVLIALALSGCGKPEGIREQTVPRIESNKNAPAVVEGKERIIGVIAPNATPAVNGWFFFKLRGPAEQVAAQLPAFEAWIESIRFEARVRGKNAEEIVTWTTPPGWKQEEPAEGDPRIAVFKFGPDGEQLDCGVSTARGGLLDNVNRWANQQLGRPQIGAGELDRVLQHRTIDGRNVFLVDLTGPGGKGKVMMMAPPHGKMN